MKKNLLFALLTVFSGFFLTAQTTILNFEAAAVSTDFQYFGMGTLDGTLTSNIANPDASGINTSSTVLEWTKEGTAYDWGGGFSNPDPMVAVDLTSDNQVCIDVWMDHIGNVALKLENSATGDNWIITKSNTMMNQWEELCFDATLPSIEAPFTAAAGHVYPTVVFFVDFGTAGTGSNVVSYLDNMVTSMGAGPTPADITFEVDMNEYSGTYSNVYVSGTFNAWCPDCDELTDPDTDGIYTGTVTGTTGTHEYKFIADAAWEEFTPFEECVVSAGGFTNRSLTVAGDMTVDANCFNSCYACGNSVQIAIELGMGDITPADSIYLAGGGVFSDPGGTFKMEDDDADGIYTISFSRETGWATYYTFANGACPDYSCKEDISGLPCAFPDNFNDRFMGPIMSDTVIATCFATCSDTSNCTIVDPPSGLINPEQALQFDIVPNIASQATVVNLDPTWGNPVITVFDVTGKMVITELAGTNTQHVLQLQDLSSGLYIVRVEAGLKSGTRKLVVE